MPVGPDARLLTPLARRTTVTTTSPMLRIVLAEDHTLVRQALRRVLESAGFDVVGEVGDGLEVADTVAARDPDVLVLDLSLPGLHGLDVLRKVGRRSPQTRVLVLTGDGREESVLGAIKGGAHGYVIKGAELEELVGAIRTLARGGRHVSPTLSAHLVRAFLDPAAQPTSGAYDTLTEREREVFHLMAEGLSNNDIGARLFVSPRTSESHRANVMRKLALRSQTEVVRYAMDRGLLPPATG